MTFASRDDGLRPCGKKNKPENPHFFSFVVKKAV
jgi:hypothetical protein